MPGYKSKLHRTWMDKAWNLLWDKWGISITTSNEVVNRD